MMRMLVPCVIFVGGIFWGLVLCLIVVHSHQTRETTCIYDSIPLKHNAP